MMSLSGDKEAGIIEAFISTSKYLDGLLNILSPFDVWDRMWNSIVSGADHCLFIYINCCRPNVT